MDALLAAYRVGARVSWRGLSREAVAAGVSAATLGSFAELVFAYIDALSAASLSGYAEELNLVGRERERDRERLAELLVRGADEEALVRVTVVDDEDEETAPAESAPGAVEPRGDAADPAARPVRPRLRGAHRSRLLPAGQSPARCPIDHGHRRHGHSQEGWRLARRLKAGPGLSRNVTALGQALGW